MSVIIYMSYAAADIELYPRNKFSFVEDTLRSSLAKTHTLAVAAQAMRKRAAAQRRSAAVTLLLCAHMERVSLVQAHLGGCSLVRRSRLHSPVYDTLSDVFC